MQRRAYIAILAVLLPLSVCHAQYCMSAGSPGPRVFRQPNPVYTVDNVVLGEGSLLCAGMGMNVGIFFTPERNCSATPQGQVFLGDQYCQDEYRLLGETNALFSISFSLAHEFAHHFQFRHNLRRGLGLPNPGPITEMQADALAGYWCGLRARDALAKGLLLGAPPDIIAAALQQKATVTCQAALRMGDFLLWHPSHHGTPAQRYELVRRGGAAGFAAALGDERAFQVSEDALMGWSLEQVRLVQP